jgi:4-diphosphocytidyl-2-C-methyl-D-erythritol kinase
VTFNSPAKVNLFLRVLKKRQDHYHDLASLFQAIDLVDLIHIEKSHEDAFTCSDASLPMDSKNLVIKACELFWKKTGLQFAVKIHLDKKIPAQAGLGGGSSNAATTLFALKQLSGLLIPCHELAEWSSEIGSDIPFFFSKGSAYCEGRGERVRDVDLPSASFTICKPAIGMSTPEVFRNLDLTKLSKENPEALLERFLIGNGLMVNDLESPAFHLHPPLKHFKEALVQQGFQKCVMSGSGSAFVCLGDGEAPPCDFHYPARSLQRKENEWY